MLNVWSTGTDGGADVVIVMAGSWALTKSEALDTLGPDRPTSSLLGPTTIGSVVGLSLLNGVSIFSALRCGVLPWVVAVGAPD